MLSNNSIANTLLWFQKAVPNPVSKNIHTQIGCHFEEVVEMIAEIKGLDANTVTLLRNAQHYLHLLAEHLKSKDGTIVICRDSREDFFDAICDQLVTGTGIAHMLGMDPVGGLDTVNISNFSKFDDDGNPIFNVNQKVMKGPNYRKADLSPFV